MATTEAGQLIGEATASPLTKLATAKKAAEDAGDGEMHDDEADAGGVGEFLGDIMGAGTCSRQ